jgi:hypothetical protein
MPLYTFACPCGHEEDRLLSFRQLEEEPQTHKCEDGEERTMERKFMVNGNIQIPPHMRAT